MLKKLFSGNPTIQPEEMDEAQVQQAIERYDRIFQGSRGYGFIDYDMTTRLAYWRGDFWSHLGYSDEDVFNDPVLKVIADGERFITMVHPEDREEYMTNLIGLLKNENCNDLVFRVARKDGSYLWVELRLFALRNESGWVSHLSGVVFDVSALKDAEQALMVSEARHARIIQASNDGIWEWSAESSGLNAERIEANGWAWFEQERNFTFSSRCWEMLGYSIKDDVVKKGLAGWRQLMHEEDGKRVDQVLTEHVFNDAPFDIEYRIRGKNGEWCWILCRGQMSHDKDGRPSILSGTNMDITALKRAEERVLKAKEEAERASQAKSEFLSSMSHELRTPLNAILGFAQLFELDSNLTLAQRDNVREIRAAGKHLLELVGDVLDLAKIEAGHLKLCFDHVFPYRIINECVGLLKSQVEKRELNVEVNFNKLENYAISADAMRLKQVFLNLISNAAKYNKIGGRIYIECSLLDDEHLRLMIEDTGNGIPESLQAELFQPFNRLGAEQTSVEGSGVGLVITKQLIEQMGGEIGFSSEKDVGSKFWADFPVTHSENTVHINPEEITTKEEHEFLPELRVHEKKKVLYVEDNPSNQKLMEQVLSKFPILDLTVVGVAVQGLYVARSTLPDLVILDVNLPGLSGLELVEILKQDPRTKHIPMIALSANVLSHDIKKGIDAGFDHYLTKPVNLNELIDVCNRFL